MRSRTAALGQESLSARIDAFRATSKPTQQILFQRPGTDLTKLQSASAQAASRLTAAKQCLAQSLSVDSSTSPASVATAHVKSDELLRSSSGPAFAAASPKLVLPSGNARTQLRALLFNPAYSAMRDVGMPDIEKKKMMESLQFLQDLQALRHRPSIDLAKQIKATYIDSANQDFDIASVSADSYGKDLQSKALNITEKHQRQFNEDFASCLKYIERGDSIQHSGLLHAFDVLEEQIALLILRNVQF